jgi:predicted transcriptional regulator
MVERQDLENWLKETGVTVIEFAVETDLHPATVYRFLNGDSMARSTLKRMHKAKERMQETFSKSKAAG